jgi:hypothetical protein
LATKRSAHSYNNFIFTTLRNSFLPMIWLREGNLAEIISPEKWYYTISS